MVVLFGIGCGCVILSKIGDHMTKEEIVKELREILKVYHYESEEQHISKDVVTSLENIIIGVTT